jgi:hypothetical protein
MRRPKVHAASADCRVQAAVAAHHQNPTNNLGEKGMKKLALLVCLAVSLVAVMQAKTQSTTVKIVSDNVAQQIADKHRHEQLGITLNAVIGGEQVLLMCSDRSKCEALKPGEYEASLQGKKVEVRFTEPVTKKARKEHFVISGSW